MKNTLIVLATLMVIGCSKKDDPQPQITSHPTPVWTTKNAVEKGNNWVIIDKDTTIFNYYELLPRKLNYGWPIPNYEYRIDMSKDTSIHLNLISKDPIIAGGFYLNDHISDPNLVFYPGDTTNHAFISMILEYHSHGKTYLPKVGYYANRSGYVYGEISCSGINMVNESDTSDTHNLIFDFGFN